MARIIHLHGSDHDEVQRLLPWYVSGELDAVEFAAVDSHLADCAECRADLAWERKIMVEVEALPLAAGEWTGQAPRLPVATAEPRRPIWAPLVDLWHAAMRPIGIGWALAAQAAIVAAAFAVVPFLSRPVMYQALSAPQPAVVGNIIVIFRPDAKEQDLRRILTLTGARLVDGPTPADAYVLRVSPGRRPAALARLQAQRDVVLAQPIDPAPPS